MEGNFRLAQEKLDSLQRKMAGSEAFRATLKCDIVIHHNEWLTEDRREKYFLLLCNAKLFSPN
jgi:hypothetical protein